jgi:hypothetical protein
VSYSPDAAPVLPSALVVKRNVPTDWGREAGRDEVAFYRFAAQHAERLPMIIPHFVATYDEETEDSLLILQDLSATHQSPVLRQQQIDQTDIPADATLYQVVETLAAFHAVWWEHPQLGTYPLAMDRNFDEEGHFRAHCQEIEQNWQSCLAAEGDWLPQDVVRDVSEMVRLLPRVAVLLETLSCAPSVDCGPFRRLPGELPGSSYRGRRTGLHDGLAIAVRQYRRV